MNCKMLHEDFLLHVDMLELIRRKSAEILYDTENGMLIRDTISNIYMMTAKDMETGKLIINKLPDNIEMLVLHQNFCLDYAIDKLKFKDKMLCYNTAYIDKKIIEIENDEVEIRKLDESYSKVVARNYSSLDLVNDEEYVVDRIKTGTVFGAFLNNELCGFVGTHEEGSIGMLEVLPKFKCKGIGSLLEATATNCALKAGRYPFGQVKEHNHPSMRLQQKLGYKFSKEKVCWLFK